MHCYAETFAERFRGVPGHPFEFGFDLRLVPEKLGDPLRWRAPRMVFVNSMSDLFHDGVPDQYVARSRAMVQGVLEARRRVLYDDLWDLALSQPMTWELDIKDWIRQWIKSGRLEPEGWRPKQRVPHRDKGNLLVWQ